MDLARGIVDMIVGQVVVIVVVAVVLSCTAGAGLTWLALSYTGKLCGG